MAENGRRGKLDPEYELLDTGVFDDDRYWIVEVDYAKADPHDLLMSIRVTNAGPEADDAARAADRLVPQHLVVGRGRDKPELRADGDARVVTEHPFLGALELVADGDGPSRRSSATTRPTAGGSSASTSASAYPKDGINDHVVSGAATVDAGSGDEGGVLVPARRSQPAQTAELRVRLRPAAAAGDRLGGLRRRRRRRGRRGRRVLRGAHARRRRPPTRRS